MKTVAVATSSGRDSTALLHCTVAQARVLGVRVLALHVHHGLQPAADDWLRQTKTQARRWGAGFDACRLQGSPGPGESVEAWARRERYQALTSMATAAGVDLVLLAHHRRDQAETWLLQALRGAGAAGLSAMPRQARRDGITWARPWLDLPREAIETYVQRHRLKYADDGSNADPRFARNRLRLQVWPSLQSAFPQLEHALADAASHAQQAAALAEEVALLDLPAVLDDEGGLQVAAWQALPPARRQNALRAWLSQVLQRGPPDALLTRLMSELLQARGRWQLPDRRWLRLYRGTLRLASRDVAEMDVESAPPAEADQPVTASVIDLSQPGSYRVPGWAGHLQIEMAETKGLGVEQLRAVVARARTGGERFHLAPQGSGRSLKKQFQLRGIDVGQRMGPLLFDSQGRLLFVPGLGMDARHWAEPGSPQLVVRWLPD